MNPTRYFSSLGCFGGVDSWPNMAYTGVYFEGSIMKDRRMTERRYLLYYARIFDSDSHQQVGNLVDITPRGIMLLSLKPFEVGKIHHLRMELTPEVSKQPHMDLTALARWSHPDIDPHLYNTGFELVETKPEDNEIIQRIIAIFGFRDNVPFEV